MKRVRQCSLSRCLHISLGIAVTFASHGCPKILCSSSPVLPSAIPSTFLRTKRAKRPVVEDILGNRRYDGDLICLAMFKALVIDERSAFKVSIGNAGIGLETVRELAKRGAVVIIGSRSVERADKAVRALEQELGKKFAMFPCLPRCSSVRVSVLL